MKIKIFFIGVIIITVVLSCNNNTKQLSVKNPTPTFQSNTSAKRVTKLLADSSKFENVNYVVEQLDNTKGLTNSSVNTIFQDSENILWIGTWDGLNRYDGNNFKIFVPKLNVENSLSNQVILKIGEDDTGLIWILTMRGINSYQKKTNTFQRYNFSNKKEFTLSESEFNMAIDNSKKVFCYVKDWGLGYFNGNQFQQIVVENLPEKIVKKMEFTSSGKLLLLFNNSELFSITFQAKENGKKTVLKAEKIMGNILTFGILPNQKICFITLNGDVILHSLLNNKNQKLIYKNVHDIIGATSNGLVLFGEKGYFIIDNFGNSKNKKWFDKLYNQKITTVIKGTENVIWAGTDGGGLLKIYPLLKPFNLVSTSLVPELEKGIVRAFAKVDGVSFFVGTKGKGLFQFPSKFYENSNRQLEYKNYNESNSSINNSVYALCKGKNDLVFIGTDGDGITVFDLKNSKIIDWSEIIDSKLCKYFKSTYTIYQDTKGFVWIGTNGYGLIRCKIERLGKKLKISHFKMYLAEEEEENVLGSNIIFSIIPKNENELWIGTRLGGLNLFNKKTDLFKVYKHDKNNSKSLSSNDILSLHIDENKNLWVGTSLGLNLLEKIRDNKAIFKNFTVKDGLPNNTIHGIVSDKKSNLWISTNFGLSNFIIKESKFINYTKKEGLQNNEFADGAYYFDKKSNFIFMGGIKGFNYFLPSKIKSSTIVPDVFIDEISGQNQEEPYYQSLVVSPYSKTFPSIVLKHNQNFFDINLSALTYINSEKCQYSYYLSNFDKNWIKIKNRNTISFTNIPQGNYSLWLKWSNSDGVFSKPVHAIDIKIKPIFWKSNIAKAVYLLLFILLILLIQSYYKKRQSLKESIILQKREEETHQNRLTFFTNIAHEFQTPLTLIIGPINKLSELANIGEKNQKFINMVQRNSSRLLFLTQQLLEFRKAEYDYLDVIVRQFDLVNLVEQIAELFDEMALQRNIEFKLEIPSELNGWFDKDKIEKIIFNLLSNAFKYTPDNGAIKFKCFIQETEIKRLNMEVVNTGKGIPKEKIDSLFDRFFLSDQGASNNPDMFRTGIGLSYVKKMVTVMRGEIAVSSVENKITTFNVSLPCSKDAFKEKELDKEFRQVLISRHLQNILEDTSTDSDLEPNKVASLNSILTDQKTILIVEDDREIHVLLNELLKGEYTILSAYNGIEALEIVKSKRPDIIVSDIMMPEMDGIEFCKIIKEDIKTATIPFIMLTSKNSIQNRIEGLESGANSYIPKPFHPDHLLIRIQKLLKEKESLQNYFSQDSIINLTNSSVNKEEKYFMEKIVALIHSNIDNENLQSLFLEKELGMSNSQLYRTIKQLFDFTPSDLIRTIRLKHAAELLQKSSLTVSEICYESGFNNRSYFYREFKKVYGITPKNYQIKTK